MANKIISKLSLFKELSQFDAKCGISRIVNVSEFTGKYSGLILGNGGSWFRFDSLGKRYKIFTCKDNGKFRYSWESSDEEKKCIKDGCGRNFVPIKLSNKIRLIGFMGYNNIIGTRTIRKDIKDIILKSPCVVCGTTTDIQADHKNGLMNDERVMNIATQVIDDFQALCQHCNCVKRETIVKQKRDGKRYSALNIPMLSSFGVAFTVGDETYDEKDKDAMVGTYWYDPVKFMKAINRRPVTGE